jgi:hypothetical protein
MTELERASVEFFKAVLKAGCDIIGHPDFLFKIDATISAKSDDADRAKLLGLRIQEAMNFAKEATTPSIITTERTSLQ